jgi:uncharacterized membrane protein
MLVVLAVAFGLGMVAGLRSATAPMVVSWAARLGWLDFSEMRAAFMADPWTSSVLTAMVIAELVIDKLPQAPSRKALPGFIVRLTVGTLVGATVAAGAGISGLIGAACGASGAVAGTLGGYEARTRLVKALNVPDLVIALIEDAIAVGGGFLLVYLLSAVAR